MSALECSSSDSDDNNNPAPPLRGAKSKSKKKRSLPPQETINKIWSRFSASRFSKATVILPQISGSSQTVAPSNPRPNNLLVSEDFERAVLECRTRVRKLIKECKRVNMRYRDPDFDIDWDLKWEKGHCLNGLVDPKFEISRHAFESPTSMVPKAVKRVHEIFNKPTFLKEKISPADVMQGNLGNCWLMASLTALANMEVGIQRICVECDTSGYLVNFWRYVLIEIPEIGIYGFVFHRGKFKTEMMERTREDSRRGPQ
jgi:hypothetical protein